MESGGSIAPREPVSGAPDAPPEPSGAGEVPGVGGALILPVFFAVAAWAVDRFTRSALGGWRYVPTAVLGLCACYFAVFAVIAMAMNFDRTPAWLARPLKVVFASKVSFAAAFAVIVCVEVVLAVRDHSAVDGLTVLVLVGWAASVRETAATSRMPRSLRRIREWARVVLPLWVFAVAIFHLR